MRFIVGFIFIGIGMFLVIKTESMLSSFGRIEWFEQHFGIEGGSRLGYKLIGFIVILFGFMIVTNMFNGFMLWVLSPLINAGR
jgi:hypothetical protein